MLDYAGNEIKFSGCAGCAYANHEFSLPCGMSYEDDMFTVSQDWELPIEGFFIVSPKRCVENMADLSDKERTRIFDLTNKVIEILRKKNVCDRFNVLFEEKPNRHFHVWIMPRHEWMNELVDDIGENIGKIFDFAKANLRTKTQFEIIEKVSNLLSNELYKDLSKESKIEKI